MQSFLLSLQQFFCHRMAEANWKFWNRLCILLPSWFRHISKADLLPICYGFMYISENCYSIVFCYFGLYRRIKVRLRDAVFEMQAQFCPPLAPALKLFFIHLKTKLKHISFFILWEQSLQSVSGLNANIMEFTDMFCIFTFP